MSKQTTIDTEEKFLPGHRACIGCGEALAVRMVCRVLGDNVIIVNATGCMEIVSSQLPFTSWMVPWIHTLFENTAAVGSGIEAATKALTRKGRVDLSKTKVVAMAGDGGTADIGFQALSGAWERGHNMLFICFDNEAYMNTGIQRSSATPYGATTTTSPAGKTSIGQSTWKKDLPAIAKNHYIPYIATACPSYPKDLMFKVKKGMEVKGPAFIQILSPCPTGWRCPTDDAIKVGRLAVQTGVFPLYEIDNGRHKITYNFTELRPVSEYLKAQGRFRHLSDAEIGKIQERTNDYWQWLKELSKLECLPPTATDYL
jgi:pyruvate ferredoxin oxidoreductase beta subunit